MLQLHISKDGQRIAEHALIPGEYLLGRSPECDIVLDDQQVSRRHARMIVGADSVHLEDLGSVNKLVVNGQQADQVELLPQQNVVIRPFVLTLAAVETGEKTMVMNIGAAEDVEDRTRVMSAPPRPAAPGAPSAEPSTASPKPGASALKNRRPLLYGVLGLVVLGLIIIVFLAGDEEESAPEPARPVDQPLEERDLDQLQRVITINLVKGKQALEAGLLQEAVNYLHQAGVADPENEEVALLLARARQALEEQRKEQERLEQRQRRMDQEIARLLAEGGVAMGNEDYILAQIFAQAVLSLQTDQVEARAMLQAATDALEQRLQALRELDLAGAQALRQGRELLEQGERVEAVQILEEFLRQDEELLSGSAPLARELAEQVKADLRRQSEPLLATAREKAKSAPRQAYEGVLTLLAIDPWNEEAEQFVQELHQRLVADGKKLFEDGLVLDSLGEHGKACAKWRRALQIVPEEDELHSRIQDRAGQCR